MKSKENRPAMVPRLNAAWHQSHPMPTHPTFDERVQWYLDHQRHCACRPIPEKLAEEMQQKGIAI